MAREFSERDTETRCHRFARPLLPGSDRESDHRDRKPNDSRLPRKLHRLPETTRRTSATTGKRVAAPKRMDSTAGRLYPPQYRRSEDQAGSVTTKTSGAREAAGKAERRLLQGEIPVSPCRTKRPVCPYGETIEHWLRGYATRPIDRL